MENGSKTNPMPKIGIVDHYAIDNIGTLLNIIRTTNTPVMVVYNTTEECYFICKAIKNACYYDGTKTMLQQWNEGKLPIMLIHPKRAAFADFSQGGHTIVWFSAPRNIADYEQTNGRLYRAGQAHKVTIHHIIDTDRPVDGWALRLKPEDEAPDAKTNT